MIPNWATVDFYAAFQRMMPRGRAWRKDEGAVVSQVSLALMSSFWRLVQSATYFLVDAFPSTTIDLIPDWNLSLGLPDACTPAALTIQQQQQAIVEKLTRGGGQSKAYYIAVAASLGYTITIVEGAPETRLWTVHAAPSGDGSLFRAGQSRAGDLLQTSGSNTQLECVLNLIKPADTVLDFSFP